MLGQPIYVLTPQVIGFKLFGKLREGVTATDLVLTVTQMLRNKGVVDKFVEFYGPGLSAMSLPDRATIGNMAPDYGATMGFFPVDAETIDYLRRTNRSDSAALVEKYTKAQGLFRTDQTADPEFTETLELDLDAVEPSVAGPKRPQDRVSLQNLKEQFEASLTRPVKQHGFELPQDKLQNKARVDGMELKHGSVVIAAITSCTNTSNPSVMVGAGLLAKKAVEKGLKVPPYVKTSLAPGSKVVTDYLRDAGLVEPLDALGFSLVGYGCTTCIGNSGPLASEIANAIRDQQLVAVSVLSGNRNFEGRINPMTQANYLASPPLVIAYALAGTTDIDLVHQPLGKGRNGEDVYLKDIWPTQQEINQTLARSLKPEQFAKEYANVFDGNERWNAISGVEGDLYNWNEYSTYIRQPPFFAGLSPEPQPIQPIRNAWVLGVFGDSVTTDHISPAGSIKATSPIWKNTTWRRRTSTSTARAAETMK